MVIGPEILVPAVGGQRVIHPIWIVVAWLTLAVGGAKLDRYIFRSKAWIVTVTGSDPLGWVEGLGLDRRDDTEQTETYTVTDLRQQLEREQNWWSRQRRFGIRAVVVGPVGEELVCRGGPYLLAMTLGGFHLPLVAFGSVVWAALHTRNPLPYRRSTPAVFFAGLLYLHLWVVGLWWLAVLVHAGNNLVATVIKVNREWQDRRHNTFTPGEEATVTVAESSSQPSKHGLYRANTPTGETLYVAAVEPGETTRVRVATPKGATGYAYPIDE